MGESLDALMAGAMPKITPIKIEKVKAKITDHVVTEDARIFAKISDPVGPNAIPIIPF